MPKNSKPSSRKHSLDSHVSLGIDIIELKRAKAFYLAHRDRLPASIRRSDRPVEALAFYLAKKEAVIKAQKRSGLRFSYFKTDKLVGVSCVGT